MIRLRIWDRVHLRPARLPLIAAVFVLGWPVVAVLQQAGVVAAGEALSALAASDWARTALTAILGDPVYAGVALQMLGGLDTSGLMLGGDVGRAMHALAPAWFALPEPGVWASAVFQPGSSLAAVTLARLLANALLVAMGFLLAVTATGGIGARHSRLGSATRAAGWLMQTYALASLLLMSLGADHLQALGLDQVATKLAGLSQAQYDGLVFGSGSLLPGLLKLVVILSAYVLLAPVLRSVGRLAGHPLRFTFRRPRIRPAMKRVGYRHLSAVGFALFALPLALFIYSTGFRGTVTFAATEAPRAVALLAVHLEPPPPYEFSLYAAPQAAPASKVLVSGSSFRYKFSVNGDPVALRGVGYNTPPVTEDVVARAQRLNRDFHLMRAAGMNVVLGWDQARFDELLLDEAQQAGIGVILPFDLPETADYGNATVRATLKQQALAWVKRYRNAPALRMWGLGNEIMHHEKNPAAQRLRDVSNFLIDTADAIHALDPDHPVIYREAEDIFVPPLAEAMATRPAPRPWFVYGMNMFTYRLSDALKGWEKRGYDLPILVSEFGAPGLRREDRPEGYLKMWRMLGTQRPMVLGGCAYVWYTEGPEALDQTFGLLKLDGTPADGTLLALATEFRAMEAASTARPTSGPTPLP